MYYIKSCIIFTREFRINVPGTFIYLAKGQKELMTSEKREWKVML